MTKTKKLAAFLLPFAVGMSAVGVGFATVHADEGEGDVTPPAETEVQSASVKFEDIPTSVYENEFGMVEKATFNYTAKASLGGFDATKENYNLVSFDTYDATSDAVGKRPTLLLSGTSGLECRNWKWFFAAKTTIVFVVESKVNGMVEFDFSECSNFGGWNEDWNSHFVVNQYVAETKSFKNIISQRMGTGKTVEAGSFTKSALYTMSLEVAEGDVIYYEVGSNAAGRNIQNLTQATISATAFDADSYVEVYGKKLDAQVEALTRTHYSDTAWAAVEKAVSDFKTGEYEDLAAAKDAYAAAVAAVKAVQPDTQVYFGAELDKVVAALKETDYEAETWAAIAKIVSDFKAEEFDTQEAMVEAYEAAKADIEGTEKDAPEFVRADLLKKMKALYEGLNEEHYTTESWATVTAAYNKYNDEQADKTDMTELKAFYAEQVAAIQAVKAIKQEISYLDLPSQMNANGYDWIKGDVFDVKLYTGNVKKGLVEFDSQRDTANELINRELYEASGNSCFVQNWKWYVGIDKGVIVAYRANTDCTVTVEDLRLASGRGNNGWTADTVLNVYIMRNDKAKSIKRVVAPSTDEDFSGTYYLKETDILYVEFITETAISARNTESPIATKAYGDATAFDEDKYIEQNHDLPKAVTDKIDELTAELNAYLETLKEEDYSATNWLQLQDYINKFVEDCDSQVETVDDVTALYNAALASMKAVPDKAQAVAELKATLDGYVAELQAKYDELVANNKYTEENRAKLDKILADGKANIEKAASKAAGNTARSAAITAMTAVETKAGGNGLGTGAIVGIVVGCVAVVAAAAVATVLVLKKKNGGKQE